MGFLDKLNAQLQTPGQPKQATETYQTRLTPGRPQLIGEAVAAAEGREKLPILAVGRYVIEIEETKQLQGHDMNPAGTYLVTMVVIESTDGGNPVGSRAVWKRDLRNERYAMSEIKGFIAATQNISFREAEGANFKRLVNASCVADQQIDPEIPANPFRGTHLLVTATQGKKPEFTNLTFAPMPTA